MDSVAPAKHLLTEGGDVKPGDIAGRILTHPAAGKDDSHDATATLPAKGVDIPARPCPGDASPDLAAHWRHPRDKDNKLLGQDTSLF